MQTEIARLQKRTYGDEECAIFTKIQPNAIGRMAFDLAKHFAIVAAAPDGEDSAGRQRYRLQTTEETVSRACDLAASLWAEFGKRGWLTELPIPAAKSRD